MIQKPKGTKDVLTEEIDKWTFTESKANYIFENYGYNPIETPILCYYDILSDKYDETNDLLKEIYKLAISNLVKVKKRTLPLRFRLPGFSAA